MTQEKRNSIKLLAQGKLDSIASIISQAMQDGDICLTRFHRILQGKEKYFKLKADINNQAMAKLKRIRKEQDKKALTRKKRKWVTFFTKNCQHFRYPGCQCHEAPPSYSMWFNGLLKTIKINLKFISPICRFSIRILIIILSCSLIDYFVTIHHDIFLNSIPFEFSHGILHQLLIIYFLVNGVLYSKLI